MSPWLSDLDHAEWLNGPEPIERDPEALNLDLYHPDFCTHGINRDEAGCGQCEIEFAIKDAALAARFDRSA